MKTYAKILLIMLIVAIVATCLVACDGASKKKMVDYASQLTLDRNSETWKMEVTVHQYIDGDTTHFNVPVTDQFPTGVLKARYLAINTPESTGKIEDYGHDASDFTKAALRSATSIIVESDDYQLNSDSTGSRYMLWVWYRTSDDAPYRLLNLELLQNGLAIASNTKNNRYGVICQKALDQAQALKLKVYSGVPDPRVPHGEAIELTLKELRRNIEQYNNCLVAFNGVITMNNNNSVYVEEYDEETGTTYGMPIFYGYNLSPSGNRMLKIGNYIRFVGVVQFYEAGGIYQLADIQYEPRSGASNPRNMQLISTGHEVSYRHVTPEEFVGNVYIEVDDVPTAYSFAEMALFTTISMDNLYVTRVYTTKTEGSSSKGAMTLYCTCNGITIQVRTEVLYKEDGSLYTEADFKNKTIDIRGMVEYYKQVDEEEGDYQIKVFSPANITVH